MHGNGQLGKFPSSVKPAFIKNPFLEGGTDGTAVLDAISC